jgi:hypothetical protein
MKCKQKYLLALCSEKKISEKGMKELITEFHFFLPSPYSKKMHASDMETAS